MSTIVHATLVYGGSILTPVRVEGATTEKEQVKFKLLHKPCGTPVQQPRTCPECKVPTGGDVIRGWEYARGSYVPIEDSDIERIRSRRVPVITIDKFTSWESAATMPVKKAYHLVDENDLVPTYPLLAETMESLQVDAIGTCNLWDRERPFKIVASGQGLLMQVLHTADELVPSPVRPLVRLDPGLLELAEMVVTRQMGPFVDGDLVIEQDRALKRLVEARASGLMAPKVSKPKPVKATTDLEAALRASVGKTTKRKAKVTA